MNTPTHEEIALKAHQLWLGRGCPEGLDTEIWLEAEQQLSDDGPTPVRGSPGGTFADNVRAETAAESEVEYHISPAGTEQEDIKAALMKEDARAPQVQQRTAPKGKPPVSGKPLWPKKRDKA